MDFESRSVILAAITIDGSIAQGVIRPYPTIAAAGLLFSSGALRRLRRDHHEYFFHLGGLRRCFFIFRKRSSANASMRALDSIQVGDVVATFVEVERFASNWGQSFRIYFKLCPVWRSRHFHASFHVRLTDVRSSRVHADELFQNLNSVLQNVAAYAAFHVLIPILFFFHDDKTTQHTTHYTSTRILNYVQAREFSIMTRH